MIDCHTSSSFLVSAACSDMMFTVITRCLRKATVRAGLPLLTRTPFGVLVRDAQDAKHLPYARLRLRSTSVGAERRFPGSSAPYEGCYGPFEVIWKTFVWDIHPIFTQTIKEIPLSKFSLSLTFFSQVAANRITNKTVQSTFNTSSQCIWKNRESLRNITKILPYLEYCSNFI